ncbi:MAG: hypothetical protein L6R40_000594 [Gallowayella cf. fulva]|nr:MAG: hypothetical protein L6R40_000594 [Xanthomendoza cf. fulva]
MIPMVNSPKVVPAAAVTHSISGSGTTAFCKDDGTGKGSQIETIARDTGRQVHVSDKLHDAILAMVHPGQSHVSVPPTPTSQSPLANDSDPPFDLRTMRAMASSCGAALL